MVDNFDIGAADQTSPPPYVQGIHICLDRGSLYTGKLYFHKASDVHRKAVLS